MEGGPERGSRGPGRGVGVHVGGPKSTKMWTPTTKIHAHEILEHTHDNPRKSGVQPRTSATIHENLEQSHENPRNTTTNPRERGGQQRKSTIIHELENTNENQQKSMNIRTLSMRFCANVMTTTKSRDCGNPQKTNRDPTQHVDFNQNVDSGRRIGLSRNWPKSNSNWFESTTGPRRINLDWPKSNWPKSSIFEN